MNFTDTFWCLFYFGIILLSGYSISSLVLGKTERPWYEVLFLSSAIGSGTVGIILFWFSLAGFTPSRSSLSIIGISAAILADYLYIKKSLLKLPDVRKIFTGIKQDWRVLSGLVVIFIMLITVILHSLFMPLYDIDAFVIWGLKAKVLMNEDLFSAVYFKRLPLSYSHLDYPLMFPFLTSGVYASIGRISSIGGKVISPFFFLSFTCFTYTMLRWKLDRKLSALLTVLMMTLPVMLRWCGAGKADVLLTLFYGGSVFYIARYCEEKKTPDIILAALFTAFCAVTKNEGLALALINTVVFMSFNVFTGFSRKSLIVSGSFFMGVFLLILPWIIWSSDIPRTHENYLSRINLVFAQENLSRLKFIVPEFMKQCLLFKRWGGLWILLIISAIFGRRSFLNKNTVLIWILFLLHILLYIFIFVITPWDPGYLALMSLERLILHTTPAVFLIIAYALHDPALSDT